MAERVGPKQRGMEMTDVQLIRDAMGRLESATTDSRLDRPVADAVVSTIRPRLRSELYAVAIAAGVEGIRPNDTKTMILYRVHRRLTARVRAAERTAV
jgi:hypothetical protein